jgi:hypothetical protein
MDQTEHKTSEVKSWVIIFLLLVIILTQGFFAFLVVGDKGQPGWDYRPVRDLPGESPYAMYETLPYPQHVRGAQGE